MFGQLGQLAGLMGKLPKIKEEFAKFQAKAADMRAEGRAGGDMVVISVNGKFAVQSCRISEEAAKMQDREILEDLIVAAANQALSKMRQMLSDEAQRVATEVGLPPGISIPGF